MKNKKPLQLIFPDLSMGDNITNDCFRRKSVWVDTRTETQRVLISGTRKGKREGQYRSRGVEGTVYWVEDRLKDVLYNRANIL